jgi:hypothetical protein
MELEILVDAPNGESDRARIHKLFEGEGYYVHSLTLKTFEQSHEHYFQAVVEQSDTFKQD